MKITDTSPISEINKALSLVFGAVPWWNYEIETLLLESGLPPSDLSREKLNLLKVLGHKPTLFYENFLFFLHAIEVANNHITDFEFLPVPTSLELAFGITDIAKTFRHSLDESPIFSEEVISAITRCLVDEGYSSAVGPFSHIGITGLTAGQTSLDTSNKLKAIETYVNSMYTEPTN